MAALRPSASVVVLSPANDVLLLHRGSGAPSFASAHVFPGGNLDPFHDGALAEETPGSPLVPPVHSESAPFRLAAARECFEECGILLAKRKDGRRGEKGDVVEMLRLDEQTREEGRKAVRDGSVRFGDWVDGVGGFVDVDNLVPFTRWITPITAPKRFSTQMYLYLLPLDPAGAADVDRSYTLPTPDGREMTHADFAPASTWLGRVRTGEITLFPPQYYLVSLVARFTSPPTAADAHSLEASSAAAPREGLAQSALTPDQLTHQRIALLTHVQYPSPPPPSLYPATSPLSPARLNPHGTALARIPPGRRIICPRTLLIRNRDSSVVLALDRPGPELQGKRLAGLGDDGGDDEVECGGDMEKVAVVLLKDGVITRTDILPREDVLREENERRQEAAAAASAAMDGVAGGEGVDIGLPGAVEKL